MRAAAIRLPLLLPALPLLLGACGLPTVLDEIMPRSSADLDPRRVRVERMRDDFTSYSTAACLDDGDQFGVWTVHFAGHGCVKVEQAGHRRALTLRPTEAASADVTHAAFVLGPALAGEYLFKVDVRTTEQLRRNSDPNPWEVGWVVWDYLDDEHFYYFIPKPNGWELGKRDPAYPGGQRFLATGDWPLYDKRRWHTIAVHTAPGISAVRVGNVELVRFVDEERPYTRGRIGFYTEDAEVQFAKTSLHW